MKSERDALAVVDNGAVVGIITPRDLLRGVQGIPNELAPVATANAMEASA
jgi:glycine betaine/proline transport system ATP-binding protein